MASPAVAAIRCAASIDARSTQPILYGERLQDHALVASLPPSQPTRSAADVHLSNHDSDPDTAGAYNVDHRMARIRPPQASNVADRTQSRRSLQGRVQRRPTAAPAAASTPPAARGKDEFRMHIIALSVSNIRRSPRRLVPAARWSTSPARSSSSHSSSAALPAAGHPRTGHST